MKRTARRKIQEKDLRFLYLDRGLVDAEIADKLECTRQSVYLARKKFGIGKLSRSERNTKLVKITSRQEEILRGSLLGDAFLGPEGTFDIQHSTKQFGYLLWLFKNLQPYFGEIRNTRTCKRIRSCSHAFGDDLRTEYYTGGRKTVTRDILNKLTPLSIAVWFMDDGLVLPSGKQAKLSTHDFTAKEQGIICQYFEEVWGIGCTVSTSSKYPQINFNSDGTEKLMGLIKHHIPVEMRYKIRSAVNLAMYLSGGMEFKEELGGPWREWLTTEFAKQGIDTIDPVKIEGPSEEGIPIQDALTSLKNKGDLESVRCIVRSALFRKDIFAIQLCDAIIVLYDESAQKGAGTLSEAWEAFREGRPVYLVSSFPMSQIPTWLIGETTIIFKSFQDLLTYTKDHDTLLKDILDARQTAEEVLGGIY